jgi:ankyrin repeat protein
MSLHRACSNGHVEVVEELVNFGADHVEAKDCNGETPLRGTCLYHGHVKVVKRLVSAGAGIHAKTNSGDTPLHWVCSYDHVRIVTALCMYLVFRSGNPYKR